MLKKISLCFLIFLSSSVVFAASSKKDVFYKTQIAYYNSVKKCSAATFNFPSLEMFGVDVNFKYIVYGKKNGKCYIREQAGGSDIKCALPMDVAKKYAEEGIKTIEASNRQGAAYSEYINQIINDKQYCEL